MDLLLEFGPWHKLDEPYPMRQSGPTLSEEETGLMRDILEDF